MNLCLPTNAKFVEQMLFLFIMYEIYYILVFCALLIFFLGYYSVLAHSRNFFRVLLGYELMYVGLILFYIGVSLICGASFGLIVVTILITVSAGEASIFLSCIVHAIIEASKRFDKKMGSDGEMDDEDDDEDEDEDI